MDEEVARLRGQCAEWFLESGELRLRAMIYATRDPKDGAPGRNVVMAMTDGSVPLPQFYQQLAQMKEGLDPAAIAVMSEAWTLIGEDPKTISGSLEHHPRRREALIFAVMRQGREEERWMAPIARDAAGAPSLGAWEHITRRSTDADRASP